MSMSQQNYAYGYPTAQQRWQPLPSHPYPPSSPVSSYHSSSPVSPSAPHGAQFPPPTEYAHSQTRPHYSPSDPLPQQQQQQLYSNHPNYSSYHQQPAPQYNSVPHISQPQPPLHVYGTYHPNPHAPPPHPQQPSSHFPANGYSQHQSPPVVYPTDMNYEDTEYTDRPFQCDLCSLSFNRGHDLKRHRETHRGDKPFSCNGGCGKTFTRKDALKRHQIVKSCGTFESET